MLLFTRYNFAFPLLSEVLLSILPNTIGNVGAISKTVEALSCSLTLTTSNNSELTVIISCLSTVTPFSFPILKANTASSVDIEMGDEMSYPNVSAEELL